MRENSARPNREAIGESLSPQRSGDFPSPGYTASHMLQSRSTANLNGKSLVSNTIIAETRRSRKIALSNLRLLSNRINVLENEDLKLKKETKEMEIKAKKIFEEKLAENKRRQEAALRTKLFEQEKLQKLSQMKEKIMETKIKHYQNLHKMNDMIQDQKRRDYAEVREQKERNENLIRAAYINNLIVKRTQLEKVKRELEVGEVRKQDYLNWKKELIQEDRERSFNEEEEKIRSELNDLHKLSKKEDLLLENLDKTFERHMNASTELYSVKNASVDGFSQKSSRFNPISVRHSRNRTNNGSTFDMKIIIADNIPMTEERHYGM